MFREESPCGCMAYTERAKGFPLATLGPKYILYGYKGPLDGLGSSWSLLQGLGHTDAGLKT